jgi:hypothetical protein
MANHTDLSKPFYYSANFEHKIERRGGQLLIEDEHTVVFAAILYGIDRSLFQSIYSPAILEATVVNKFMDWTNAGRSRCCDA